MRQYEPAAPLHNGIYLTAMETFQELRPGAAASRRFRNRVPSHDARVTPRSMVFPEHGPKSTACADTVSTERPTAT